MLLYIAWAIGSDGYFLPEHVGLPMGGSPITDDTFIYAAMEIHYDNRYYRDDIIDSSGFRLWYTSNTRPYDLGIVQVGLFTNYFGQFIVPGLYIWYTKYISFL